jgi:predicted ATPase
VLYGQFAYHLVKGPLRAARALAAELLQRGEHGADRPITAIGHRTIAVTCFHLGELLTAREHLEQALARFDPAHRPLYASSYVMDPLVAVLYYLQWDLCCLGYLDQARFQSEAAAEEAHKLGHTFSLSASLAMACFVDWATRSHEEMRARADAVIAISDEHDFSYNRAIGTVFRGWALGGSGQTTEGITLLRAGLAAYRATGAMIYVPFILTLLADAEGKAKERDQGLDHLAEAERLMAATEERWAEAELYRVRGKLLSAGYDPIAAERSFSQAIDIAQRQSAKFWELRAATSLARLWREQGKRDAARDLLAPIYGWFTEGFDTPVLKEAKALLDELAR